MTARPIPDGERERVIAYWQRPENYTEAERLGFLLPLRERVARIIDPDNWTTFDYLAALPEPYLEHITRVCAASLTKAYQIIALRQNQSQGDG